MGHDDLGELWKFSSSVERLCIGSNFCSNYGGMMSKIKGLAVASGGGHWQQLMLLSPAFNAYEVVYVSTSERFVDIKCYKDLRIINDANRHDIFGVLKCIFQCIVLIWKEKPDFIISTGALPGLICIAVGRLCRANTLWIDSLANAERPSMCGRVAYRLVDHWFTQWEHLASPGLGEFEGALL
jgi:UDP-N-acetylglucosamine:LPS N-acetylglucosamine transferase